MNNRKDGQYYYAPRRRSWGVWQYKENAGGTFYNDYFTKEEARREVFRLNGWKLKESNDAGTEQSL